LSFIVYDICILSHFFFTHQIFTDCKKAEYQQSKLNGMRVQSRLGLVQTLSLFLKIYMFCA